MRALVLSVAVLMSTVASAQNAATQGLSRPPPPGQPTGPIHTRPAPPAPIPGYNQGPGYDDWDAPEGFRRRGTLAVVEREEMIERLARMEQLLAQVANDTGNRRGREAARKLRDELDAMRYEVNNSPDLRAFRQRPRPPAPPPQPVVQPISEHQLQDLIRAINKESFGDGKLRVIALAAPSQHFVVPQVMKILQRFSFSQDKLKALRTLWPRVLDRQNGYQLLQAFSHSSDKEQAQAIISN